MSMKKILLLSALLFSLAFSPVTGQDTPEFSKIDILIIRGENYKVIDTCRQILATDSLNAEIWYKLGFAYQNLMSEEKSFACFSKASSLSPASNRYSFMVAKGFYNKNKPQLAKPYLIKLSTADSMNWAYSHYLTSIMMQEGNYNDAIKIYTRFYLQDTTNSTFLDKIGFATLKIGNLPMAKRLYSKSLALNSRNVSAMKNLAYIFSMENKADTAIKILTRAIETDPADMDLYSRRGGVYFAINYNKKALNDYLKILSSGDSTILYIKRAGIGYQNNLQPKEAIKYLLIAYKKDSTDYETASLLGQNYYHLADYKKSIRYYKMVTKLLSPAVGQMGVATIMLAEAQKNAGLYQDAISSYLSAMKVSNDPSLNMIIANIYDEQLKDVPKAIYYYELYLANVKKMNKAAFTSEYAESIKKRVEFLKNPPPIIKEP
jgi:tetratricopeptide (TPR) repeat protein